MRELYSLCQAPKKIWRDFEDGMHNDTIARPYFFDYLVQFVRDVLGGEKMDARLWKS